MELHRGAAVWRKIKWIIMELLDTLQRLPKSQMSEEGAAAAP